MTITRREFEELRRELARTRQELAQRPLFGGGGGSNAVYHLVIIGGNTLDDAVTDGIKYEATPLTDVPSVYDPTIDTTFVDGIGRAVLYIDGVAQADYVLVLHDSSGGTIVDALFADDLCLTSPTTVTLPLSGDPTQSVSLYRALTP